MTYLNLVSLEHLVVTGKVEGRRARRRQRLKFLDSLSTCWEDKVSPIEIVRTAEVRMLWHQMVANVVHNGMPPYNVTFLLLHTLD